MSHAPPTRILLLGAQSTGKTTLARALVSTWSKHTDTPTPVLIDEVARKVMADKGFTRDDVETDPAFQTSILLSQLAHETSTSPPCISDRCLIDPLVYTSLYFSASVFAELVDTPGVAGMLEVYRSEQTMLVLLEPVEDFWVDDGARKLVGAGTTEPMEEWWAVSHRFEAMLDKFEITSYHRLGEGCKDLDARVRQVHAWRRGEQQ